MMELLPYSWTLALTWFVIFWLVGGVFFAIISVMRTAKLRKAHFSCLFTLSTLLAACGAAYGGLYLGQGQIETCMVEAQDYFDALAAVYGCGVLELFAAAGLAFLALVFVGFILLFICRPKNDSWVDSHEGLKKEVEISFDRA